MRLTFDLPIHIVVDVADGTTTCPAELAGRLKGIYVPPLVWNGDPIAAGDTIGSDASMTAVSIYAHDTPDFVRID